MIWCLPDGELCWGQGREELSGERQHERQLEGRKNSFFRTCSDSIAVILSGRKCQKVSRGHHIMSSPMLCVTELGFTLYM